MSVAHDIAFGPYTAEDLHAMPEEGKGFELVDGWLIELSPSTPHSMVVRRLFRIMDAAATAARVDQLVVSGSDVATGAGVRRPDVMVIDGKAARTAARLGRSAFYAGDVQLVVEVVSRGSASEREDRVRKLTEYAHAGIPEYWIVDFAPDARIQVHRLAGGTYQVAAIVDERQTLRIDSPFKVEFDPTDLVDWRATEG